MFFSYLVLFSLFRVELKLLLLWKFISQIVYPAPKIKCTQIHPKTLKNTSYPKMSVLQIQCTLENGILKIIAVTIYNQNRSAYCCTQKSLHDYTKNPGNRCNIWILKAIGQTLSLIVQGAEDRNRRCGFLTVKTYFPDCVSCSKNQVYAEHTELGVRLR